MVGGVARYGPADWACAGAPAASMKISAAATRQQRRADRFARRYGRVHSARVRRRRRYNRPPMPVVDPPLQRPPATGSDGGSGEPRGASSARSLRNSRARQRRRPCSPARRSPAVGGRAPDRAELRPVVVDRVGQEVTDPHLSFVVSGGPSWKPLPFLFTTIYGPVRQRRADVVGDHRADGGLLGLWRRLAPREPLDRRRLARGDRGRLAVVGVVLTQDWFYYFLRGTSEVVLIGVTLWADRPAARRPQAAGVPAGMRGGADPPRMVAVHLPLRAVVVVPRAGVQDHQDPRPAARRAVRAAVLLVRAAVGRLRRSVPGRDPRGRLQRPPGPTRSAP